MELLKFGVTKKKEISDSKKDNFAHILAYISEHAFEKNSIDEIAKQVHMSKYYLCRLFKEKTGRTIGDFIKERRLSASKQMLISTRETIASISEKCGFYDSSYFSKTFFSEYGISPSSFRKSYK